MSTLATTNIKHESASTPNITLTSGGATTVNGTLNLGSSPLVTPTGDAPSYTCRAWVNWDGTLSNPITPRASGNVSSVGKTGAGQFTVNFTTAMPDTNYGVALGCGAATTIHTTGTTATTSIDIRTNATGTTTVTNSGSNYVAIFR
jgi:hypothetical protein